MEKSSLSKGEISRFDPEEGHQISGCSITVVRQPPNLFVGVRFSPSGPILMKGVNMKKLNLEEVKTYIESQSPTTKIYLGCDSEKYRVDDVWYADYILAIVVHIDGRHGCKIFGEVQTEKDFDKKVNKPRYRLMNEVYKVSELYLKLSEVLEGRDVEVHLDINPNEMYGSSCVINEAIGYIKGTCNVIPLVKPNAWAASYCADRFKTLKIA